MPVVQGQRPSQLLGILGNLTGMSEQRRQQANDILQALPVRLQGIINQAIERERLFYQQDQAASEARKGQRQALGLSAGIGAAGGAVGGAVLGPAFGLSAGAGALAGGGLGAAGGSLGTIGSTFGAASDSSPMPNLFQNPANKSTIPTQAERIQKMMTPEPGSFEPSTFDPADIGRGITYPGSNRPAGVDAPAFSPTQTATSPQKLSMAIDKLKQSGQKAISKGNIDEALGIVDQIVKVMS